MATIIDKIKKRNFCIGCGLCASVLGSGKCNMELSEDGFYYPIIKNSISNNESKVISRLCPGIHIEGNKQNGVWGSMNSIEEAWSADSSIRHKAASGGIVTSLAIYLLESHTVDAVLQVGVKEGSYLHNTLKISRTREAIINNAQSRYAPALVFNDIIKILDSSNDKYAFVGKPCDIAAMKNLLSEFPKYNDRIKAFISIFCAGMPSYNASIKTWQMSGRTDEPISLKYRGDGWPGNFRAIWQDGTDFKLSYNDSWGKILGRQIGFRCKICPDGIGMLADVAVGDSWATTNGYPDFTEKEGRCFVMVRTDNGTAIMEEAEQKGYIVRNTLDINKIAEMQAYQYNRRKMEGWRLVPVQLFSGFMLKFKGLHIFRQAISAKLTTGIKQMLGTAKRMIKS